MFKIWVQAPVFLKVKSVRKRASHERGLPRNAMFGFVTAVVAKEKILHNVLKIGNNHYRLQVSVLSTPISLAKLTQIG